MNVRSNHSTKSEFPYVPGQEVGYEGFRATITRIHPTYRKVNLRWITIPGVVVHESGVSVDALTDPPERAPHVEEAGRETAIFLANPRKVFES